MITKITTSVVKETPDAIRVYEIYVGGDVYTLVAQTNSSVNTVLEKIYLNAIKHDTDLGSID